jgi:prophage antirepressor-like protein
MSEMVVNEITKIYNGSEVFFKEGNGEAKVRVDEVARFCGWVQTDIKNGKEYNTVKWSRVNGYLDELGFDHKCTKGDFIPEYIMYPLIGKAKNEQATNFMLWVGQVIAEIRKNGMYISDRATTAQKKYNYNLLDITFSDCPLEKLQNTYNECLTYHRNNKTRIPYAANSKRRKDATHTHADSKLMVMDRIINTLEKRRENLLGSYQVGLCVSIDETIKSIKDDIKTQHNLISRGKTGSQTKKINDLQKQLNYYCPNLFEFTRIDYHPFSVNYMTKIIQPSGGGFKTVTSDAYRAWQSHFPDDQINDDIDIDFSEKVYIWLRFDCLDRFDVTNLEKTFIDQLCRHFGVDDNNIEIQECTVNEHVNSYEDGHIFYLFRQA